MTVTRTVVRTWLAGARLPLTIAESTLRRGEQDNEWKPALAFGAFEGGVKQLVGRITRDDELVREGHLEREQVSELRKATQLEAVAEIRKQEADTQLEDRLERNEQRREQLDDTAEERRRRVEDEAQAKARRAEERARKKAETARAAESTTKKAVAKTARTARAKAVTEERGAVSKERSAVAAKQEAAQIDEQLEEAKAARRQAR
jgi:hypothetical protein